MTEFEAARLRTCLARFDAANAEDPGLEPDGSPKALAYAQRMSEWLERLDPEAPVELRLAVRAQHIRRWEIPRDSYPKGRTAYLQWRRDLGRYHADVAGTIMRECGYDGETVARVQSVIRKERFKADPWAQRLEDVACLVFLEHYFETFAEEQDRDSIVNILQRTWKKMSEAGRKAALTIDHSPPCADLMQSALEPSPEAGASGN